MDRNIDSKLFESIDFIDDLGMDSLSFVSIVIELESIFDIIIPDEMLLMDTFEMLIVLLKLLKK